jgi:hypothetical protein
VFQEISNFAPTKQKFSETSAAITKNKQKLLLMKEVKAAVHPPNQF